MKKFLIWAAALCLSSQAYAFKAGEWEFTTQTSMQGMPQFPSGMSMPSFTFKNCLKEEQAVPQRENGERKCKVTKMDRQGDKVDWEVSCETPRGEMKGIGSATYSGDTMHLNMRFTSGPMEIAENMTGRYLGPCSK